MSCSSLLIPVLITLTTLLLGLAFKRTDAPPALTVDVRPHVCGAPCTLRVQARVDPRPENRLLEILVESDHYVSLSMHDVDETSPRTLPFFWFRDVPEGVYDVTVIVHRADGSTVQQTQRVEVR